jgi:EpsD family peptidyl-prolyl cis-trans isomerase
MNNIRTLKAERSAHPIIALPLLMLCLAASGCGKTEDKQAPSQVAAKVNATEITVYQVNNVLARTPNVTPATESRVKRGILDNLIEQQLAKQQAIEQKLDRSPAVLQTLESAKTEILARAYVDRIGAALPKPTPEEVTKYYAEHAELFAQRRVYSIEDISVATQPGLAAKLREEVVTARSLEDVAAWLNAQKIAFAAKSGVRAAEQLPLEYLPQISSMKNGEMRAFELPTDVEVIRLVASKPAPLTEAAAIPQIQQFLLSQRLSVAISADMKQLKQLAKVEYAGEFAKTAAENEASARAQVEATAKADTEAKSRVDAGTRLIAEAKAKADLLDQARADALTKARAETEKSRREAEAASPPSKTASLPTDAIEKGVRGLK